MLGYGLFSQVHLGILIGGESTQTDIQSAQYAADLGFRENRPMFQLAESFLDGLCVVVLDGGCDAQSGEDDKERQAPDRGKLSNQRSRSVWGGHRGIESSANKRPNGSLVHFG